MRHRSLVPLAVLLAFCGSVWCAAFELSADAMREVEDTVQSLDSNLSLKNPKALAEAQELLRFFQQAEGHYAARGDAPQGVDFSKQSQQHADKVAQAVQAGDFDGAQDALTQLTRTCKRCHEVYKKKN